jgi:hypothetical protein
MILPDHYLPAESIRRLDVIRARAISERSVRENLLGHQRDAIARKGPATTEAERLRRYLRNSHIATEQVKADAAVDAIQAEIDKINARLRDLPTSATALDGRVERFLKTLRGPVKAAPDVRTSAPKRGESPSAAVERLRGERASLLADLREVRAAPVTAAEAKAVIREQIDALAAQGAPDVLGTVEAGVPFAWPRGMMDADRRSVSGYLPSVVPFIFWLARDAITEKLCAEVDELSDDSRSLDTAERGYREDLLATQILNVERAEAEQIWQADQADVQIPFRSDTDLPAVLGLANEVEVTQ